MMVREFDTRGWMKMSKKQRGGKGKKRISLAHHDTCSGPGPMPTLSTLRERKIYYDYCSGCGAQSEDWIKQLIDTMGSSGSLREQRVLNCEKRSGQQTKRRPAKC
jgi:hypothetical protein